MGAVKIMGDAYFIRVALSDWSNEITVRSGHTVIPVDDTVESKQRAKAIVRKLVTEYRFTALNTTVPDAPERFARVSSYNPAVHTEVVLVPQIAGGS